MGKAELFASVSFTEQWLCYRQGKLQPVSMSCALSHQNLWQQTCRLEKGQKVR